LRKNPDIQEDALMKQYITLSLMLMLTMSIVGCESSAEEADSNAADEATKLEESPDYEKEMMGEMGGDAGK
jgi:hypothetical protein